MWLSIALKRLIYSMHIHKSGSKCKLVFNSMFGQKREEIYSTGDFGGLQLSKYGLHTFDSNKEGMFFMDFDNNIYKDYPGNDKIIEKICKF